MPAPLHRPNFRWFFAGLLVSLLGSAMAPVALAFAVLDASGSASELGLVLAARMVPLLVFLLVGGAVADRFSRRTLLLLANLGSGLTQGAVAVLLLTGQYTLPGIAALEVVNGVLGAFTTPALRGVVPDLVDAAELQPANALLSATSNAAKILGPSIAGLIVVGAGSGTAIALDAVSFLLAAGCLARLRLTTAAAPQRRGGVLRDIRDGWNEFRRIRWVWVVCVAFCLINLVQTGTWQILGPLLVRESSGAAAWGAVLSVRGIGLLVMSAVLYRLVVTHLLRFGQLLSALGALPLLALGLSLPLGWLLACAFVAGLGSAAAGIGWDTSLQEHVPGPVLSRVASYDDLLSYAAIPIGQLAVGPLSDAVGGARVTLSAGIVFAVVALLPLGVAAVRRLPHAPAAERSRAESK